MANLEINFAKEINISLQKGDIIMFEKNGQLKVVGPYKKLELTSL